jgi:hypothetical protein
MSAVFFKTKIGFPLQVKVPGSPAFKADKSIVVNPPAKTLGSGSHTCFIPYKDAAPPTAATAANE